MNDVKMAILGSISNEICESLETDLNMNRMHWHRKLWEIGDIVALVEAEEAKAIRTRGPYKICDN